MTSLLTHIDTTLSQLNSQQQPLQDISLHIPKLNENIDSPFSNQVKPSTLLAKRLEVSELGDLITKRVKTQSTNISENGSIQHSPTSKKNSAANEKDKDDSSTTTFTRCSSTESANGLSIQDIFTGSPVVIDIDTQSFPMSTDESGFQLQLALNMLREKMIEQEAQSLIDMFLLAQLCQEPLYIPPLVESVSNLVEPSVNKVKKQANKKNVKKIELDQEVSYGAIEYPFLSISTPFTEDADLSAIPKLDLTAIGGVNTSLTCEKVAVSTVEKKVKKFLIKRQAPAGVKSPGDERKNEVQVKDEKKMLGKKVLISKVVEKVMQKKSKENEKEKKVEKDVESPKTVKEEENIYSRPVFNGKRFTQRTKNKWQIAQDEKVKDLVLPAPNSNGGYELLFAGNKKKAVPIGDEYQVDVSTLALQRGESTRRKPQMKWDPSVHDETELKKLFSKVKTMVHGDINEEKVVGVILDNKNDLKKAVKYITANKSKCLDTLRC